jgi:hypothetical protein
MESAVQRARATARSSSPPPPARPFEPPPPPHSFGDEPATEAPGHQGGLDERWLIVSVAVAATLVVIGAIALALSLGSGGPQQAAPPASPSVTTPSHGSPPAPSHPPRTSAGHQRGSPASTATTTTTAPPAAPGGPPVISTLSPASGAPGQGIEVAGSNFLSSSGQIVATFNGQVAPTSCPAQNVCTVTVPPMTSPGAAQVVITTATGTSNALTFTYS